MLYFKIQLFCMNKINQRNNHGFSFKNISQFPEGALRSPGKMVCYTIMKIKRFRSWYSLQENLWNCPGHQGYVYLKSHQVYEEKDAILTKHIHDSNNTIVESEDWSRPYTGAGQWDSGPNGVLRLYYRYAKCREQCWT